jgi:hypothetical protein
MSTADESREELARTIHSGFFGLSDGGWDDEDMAIADAILASSWLEGERARVRTYDEEALAQALYRTLYDAGVSFSSNDVIPKLTATVRAVMTDHTNGGDE